MDNCAIWISNIWSHVSIDLFQVDRALYILKLFNLPPDYQCLKIIKYLQSIHYVVPGPLMESLQKLRLLKMHKIVSESFHYLESFSNRITCLVHSTAPLADFVA